MDKRLRQLFEWEVAFQCKCVLRAYDHLQAASNKPMRMRDVSEIWYALQALVIAAANIQKLALGQGGKRAIPRADLRTSLGIADSSPLHDPDLRNDFEHFDERLDDWYAKTPSTTYAVRGLISGVPLGDYGGFGAYDRKAEVVTFALRQHSLAIAPIVAEARRILALIEGWEGLPST